MSKRLAAAAFAALTGASVAQQPATAPHATWQNFNRTFQLELPADWRQIAPNEARDVGKHEGAPLDLRFAQPTSLYAVGPVDRWLAGDFSGPFLVVREQPENWYVDDDYAATLRSGWQEFAENTGTTQVVRDIGKEAFGTQLVECIVARRTATPAAPAPPIESLDVYAPTARQQLTLSFCCPAGELEQHEPQFRRWLESLTFARLASEQPSLTDKLWTPLVFGAAVGIVLLVLYKKTRAR